MLVAKWGNSLAVRIPADVARELGITEGDAIDLKRASDRTIEVVTETDRQRWATDAIKRLSRPLPSDYKFDREEANAR